MNHPSGRAERLKIKRKKYAKASTKETGAEEKPLRKQYLQSLQDKETEDDLRRARRTEDFEGLIT
jgi:hypothetical protein